MRTIIALLMIAAIAAGPIRAQKSIVPLSVTRLSEKSKRWAVLVGIDAYDDPNIGRLQGGEAIEAEALEDAADGRRRDAEFGGDLLAGEALTAQGRDTESQVLARAVKWHSEHRVLLNGHKTVIFK